MHHVEAKVGGWYDTSLTDAGRMQAVRIAKSLRGRIESSDPAITSSDLLRAKETADVIAGEFKSAVILDSDFREISYGIAEGKPQQWLDERISPAPEDNRLDHLNIEGGESKREFISRIYRAIDKILADDNANQVIVTHGFALTFVVSRWIGLPIDAAGLVNFQSTPGSITHLEEDDLWRNRGVRVLSDASHLEI